HSAFSSWGLAVGGAAPGAVARRGGKIAGQRRFGTAAIRVPAGLCFTGARRRALPAPGRQRRYLWRLGLRLFGDEGGLGHDSALGAGRGAVAAGRGADGRLRAGAGGTLRALASAPGDGGGGAVVSGRPWLPVLGAGAGLERPGRGAVFDHSAVGGAGRGALARGDPFGLAGLQRPGPGHGGHSLVGGSGALVGGGAGIAGRSGGDFAGGAVLGAGFDLLHARGAAVVGGAGGGGGGVLRRHLLAGRGPADGRVARLPSRASVGGVPRSGAVPGAGELDDRLLLLPVAAQGGLAGTGFDLCLRHPAGGGGAGMGAGGRGHHAAHAGGDGAAVGGGGADRAGAEQAADGGAGGGDGVAGGGDAVSAAREWLQLQAAVALRQRSRHRQFRFRCGLPRRGGLPVGVRARHGAFACDLALRPATSDRRVFEQVFLEEQYDVAKLARWRQLRGAAEAAARPPLVLDLG